MNSFLGKQVFLILRYRVEVSSLRVSESSDVFFFTNKIKVRDFFSSDFRVKAGFFKEFFTWIFFSENSGCDSFAVKISPCPQINKTWAIFRIGFASTLQVVNELFSIFLDVNYKKIINNPDIEPMSRLGF